MQLSEAVDILWQQTRELFGPSDKEYLRRFMGAFIDHARTRYMPSYNKEIMDALGVFARAPLRDVRTELERLWDEVDGEVANEAPEPE